MTFRLANVSGRAALVDGDEYHDLAELTGGAIGPDPMAALADLDALHRWSAELSGRAATGRLADVELGPPVPRPGNVFGIGLNYAEHVAESGRELPDVPVVFTKFPSCIVGPGADVVLASDAADYEVEMVVVIGRTARDVDAADAWDHVAGMTVGQDISDRALQFAAKPPHFDLGKSRDTYGPIGPVLASPDCFDDPDGLELSCLVNGVEVQRSTTKHLIFDVPTLVEYLSAILTLSPGDLIFTGTPDGVGAVTGRFLSDGDVIVSEIAGVGVMTNHCVGAV